MVKVLPAGWPESKACALNHCTYCLGRSSSHSWPWFFPWDLAAGPHPPDEHALHLAKLSLGSLFVCLFPFLEVLFRKPILGPLSAFIKIGTIHPKCRSNKIPTKFLPESVVPGRLSPRGGAPQQCAVLDCLAGAAQLGVKEELLIDLGLCLFLPTWGHHSPRMPSLACLQVPLRELSEAVLPAQSPLVCPLPR